MIDVARYTPALAAERVGELCDLAFADAVFDPSEQERPFLDPAYRAALPQGYDGFNYVGEYWDRYRTCFQCHRDGGRYTAESNRITFHDSERKERARPRENELGFLW